MARPLMTRVEDYAHMWWAEGFPSRVQDAPWLRVVQTGCYALALDTATLRVPHFGAVPAGVGYEACARSDNRAWERLPPADLTLTVTANGTLYRCTAGGKWTQTAGPRLIESGRFMQRADVTDLVFESADGKRLNAEARFETVAWPDRLGLLLAVRPGRQPIPAGEPCFGRMGGGFGLDGTNHFEVPLSRDMDPERFTLELWAYVPRDFQVSRRTPPWLVCKGPHEHAAGNYGIVINGGRPQARINIGGGRENAITVDSKHGLSVDTWNHFALSYDGNVFRFYVNGTKAGEQQIGRTRVPSSGGLAFGRRQDNSGDGYHFRGVVDEIRLYGRALTDAELHDRYTHADPVLPGVKPVFERTFHADGPAASTQPCERWDNPSVSLGLVADKGRWLERTAWKDDRECVWREVSVMLDADEIRGATEQGFGAALRRLFAGKDEPLPPVSVHACDRTRGVACPVEYDAARGWHRVTLDGVEPIMPADGGHDKNDELERVRLTLRNPAGREQPVRLLFDKRRGVSITGVSALLRDMAGNPTGLPVQLSKNWHKRPEGDIYEGPWFHGFSFVRLPPHATAELELTLAYGHWGGVAAASHAQLCLIGWGSNQLWDQSAMGSWGESICYEPDRVQAQAAILDVRPVMVKSMSGNAQWGWTHNVGGGDFFRLFDSAGQRVFPARMRTAYVRQGPCLTEVTYAGRLGEGVEHAVTVSLARTDDIVRGVYHVRFDVRQHVEFSRFVIFQIGADTYSYTGERKMALGNEHGLLREWDTQWGGETVRAGPLECVGRVPWISLHEAVSRADWKAAAKGKPVSEGAWANRGIVIRAWKARLGGKAAAPWLVEHGIRTQGADTSTADLVPPPGITRLEPGDFVDATCELVIMPQFAEDYYGPNHALRAALEKDANTWRMIFREAAGNVRTVEMTRGHLERVHPAVRVRTEGQCATFTLNGGVGYVPVTLTGLTSCGGFTLHVDGRPVEQSVHGNDYWQTDYDPTLREWAVTYTLPVSEGQRHVLHFSKDRLP